MEGVRVGIVDLDLANAEPPAFFGVCSAISATQIPSIYSQLRSFHPQEPRT